MNGYVVLLKYVPTARQHATAEAVRRRLEPVLESAVRTLDGELISLDVTMGAYDYVARLQIPAGQDLKIFECLRRFGEPGDFEITVLRAFGIDEVYPR